MKTLTKLQKEITKLKNKLQKQLNKGIIYENFGMSEYRALNDEYGMFSNAEYFSTDERKTALTLIDQFFNWCTNATPSY